MFLEAVGHYHFFTEPKHGQKSTVVASRAQFLVVSNDGFWRYFCLFRLSIMQCSNICSTTCSQTIQSVYIFSYITIKYPRELDIAMGNGLFSSMISVLKIVVFQFAKREMP